MAQENSKMPFGKKNYSMMLIGLAVLFIGFIIMSMDSTTFGFGFLGLTLGPLVVFAGFMLQFVALLSKPK
jgi:isoprenylcysteine carboxyl methyltransferase (ICMT) family protein YpbQ